MKNYHEIISWLLDEIPAAIYHSVIELTIIFIFAIIVNFFYKKIHISGKELKYEGYDRLGNKVEITWFHTDENFYKIRCDYHGSIVPIIIVHVNRDSIKFTHKLKMLCWSIFIKKNIPKFFIDSYVLNDSYLINKKEYG